MLYVVLRPSLYPKREIFQGVYYSCLEVGREYGDGKVMITEIHWAEPGVELFFRPFYPASFGRKHFTLLPADYLLWKHELSVLINSTRYLPSEWWKSFPLRKVDSLETLVWEGKTSHMHPHSYMLGWDEALDFHYELQKPPSRENLDRLRWGIGVQSISVLDGLPRLEAMNLRAKPDSKTFLGVDPDRKVLWFLVFENVNELGMNTVALEAGVQVGGQLDASDASTMIIGPGAQEVRSYTGIRGKRPLAGVLGVRAQPLDGN